MLNYLILGCAKTYRNVNLQIHFAELRDILHQKFMKLWIIITHATGGVTVYLYTSFLLMDRCGTFARKIAMACSMTSD